MHPFSIASHWQHPTLLSTCHRVVILLCMVAKLQTILQTLPILTCLSTACLLVYSSSVESPADVPAEVLTCEPAGSTLSRPLFWKPICPGASEKRKENLLDLSVCSLHRCKLSLKLFIKCRGTDVISLFRSPCLSTCSLPIST